MNSKSAIDIDITAKDLASSVLKNVDNNLNEVKDSTTGLGAGALKLNAILEIATKVFDFVAGAIKGVISVGKQAIAVFIEMSDRGGQLQGVAAGFAKNFGDSTKALNDLRDASKGTISDFDLMLSSNKAALLGVSANSEQLARLLEVARARGQQLGIDTTQAFEDIVTGIGRMSPLILDNLGITTGAYKTQVEALEARGVELDENAKKELLMQSVLADTTVAMNTSSESIARVKSFVTNLTDEISLALAPVMTYLVENVLPVLTEWFNSAKTALSEWWAGAKEEVMPKIIELKDNLVILWGVLQDVWAEVITGDEAMENAATGSLVAIIDGFTTFTKYLIDNKQAIKDVVTVVYTLIVGIVGLAGAIKAAYDWVASMITKYNEWRASMSVLGGTIDSIKSKLDALTGAGNKATASLKGIGSGAMSGAGVSGADNLSNKVGNFSDGGIVGGNSFSGDKLQANVNSGEMILTRQQQAMLFKNIDNGGGGGGDTYNITGNTFDSQSTVDYMINRLKEISANENKLSKYNLTI